MSDNGSVMGMKAAVAGKLQLGMASEVTQGPSGGPAEGGSRGDENH
jgi:hypothetical protein